MSDIDWTTEASTVAGSAELRTEWTVKCAQWLARPDDRLVVDLGCGGAGMAIALAGHSPAARVVGVDGEPAMLREASAAVARAGLTDRVELVQLDLHHGTAGLGAAVGDDPDLIWAAGVVHHVGDQQSTVDGLAASLRPGGRLALAEGGLATRNLPWDIGVGEPGLQVRTEAALDGWFRRMRAGRPGSVPMPYGWGNALRRAGLVDVTSRAFLLHRPAPLDPSVLDLVVASIAMSLRSLRPTGLLSDVDLATWDRLLDPDDAAWLGHRDDVFALSASTVHVGSRPTT